MVMGKKKKEVKKRNRRIPSMSSGVVLNPKKANRESLWGRYGLMGRPKAFASAKEILDEAIEYVQWTEANPLKSSQLTSVKGIPYIQELPVTRIPTLDGFAIRAGINPSYFRNPPQDFSTVIGLVRDMFRDAQIGAAAGGLVNANIISRLQKLSENIDHTSGGEAIKMPSINVYNTAPPLASSEDEIKE